MRCRFCLLGIDRFMRTRVKHRSEFGNLSVYACLLRFISVNGGGDYFSSEFCWHVNRLLYSP